jgi:ATP-binding cassette subfamily C (CFTR/MRP) protein 1
MVILMTQIGFIPALIGMVCVALTIPIQSKCARVIGSMRRQMVTVTDTRVALISEVLQIIRAVKLYAWETMLFTRVKTIRAEEIRTMWRYIVSNALLRDVNQISPVVTACLIFTTLVFVVYNHHPSGDTENNINGGSDDSSHLTTARAVTILAYLNIIRFPLQLLGVALKFCVDGNVSLVRLNAFFMLDVLPPRESGSESVDTCDGGSDASIVFKGASFSWLATEKDANHGAVLEIESDEKQISDASSHKKDTYSQVVSSPLFDTDEGDHSAGKLDRDDESSSFNIKSSQSSLTDLNITIEAGELIAVIGTVGSGKSNFIAAILGEMPCTQGRCSVHGNVAYSAQTPWIQNMTVQDNILFGDDLASTKEPHLSEQYKKCLHQAALSTDLKNLPHGDQTGTPIINLVC